MKTENRLKNIEESVLRIENTLESFAISVKEQFDRIDQRFTDVEQKLDTKADKEDIARIERYFDGHENRVLRLEDGMQIVRGKLKFKN